MTIQIIGAKGMLGQAVIRAAIHRGHEVVTTLVDITMIGTGDIKAPIVINCAGIVKQRKVPDSHMMLVNAYGPHRIAEMCDKKDARLIHVSSDCVFAHPGPHNEDDTPTGSDIYAISKRAGEVIQPPHLTVRTSFVGDGPLGLIHDLRQHRPIRASRALFWSGHTVETVAECLIMLAERPDITGLLHIPGTFQTRLELVQNLIEHLNLDVEVIEDNAFAQDRRLISTRWLNLKLPYLAPFWEQLLQSEWV